MRNILRLSILVIAVSLGPLHSSAQHEKCSELFGIAYAKMKKRQAHQPSSLSMSYSVAVTLPDNETYTDRIEVKMHNKKSAVISKDVALYQDGSTLVAIRPAGNVIFLTRPLPESLKQSQMGDLVKLQDTLFQHMTMKSCESVTNEGKPLTKQVFVLSRDHYERLGVSAITYWMDEATVEMKKVRIDYAGNPRIKTLEYSIDEWNTDYRQSPFEGTALSVVMTGEVLKSKYKGYSLTDKRNEKRKDVNN